MQNMECIGYFIHYNIIFKGENNMILHITNMDKLSLTDLLRMLRHPERYSQNQYNMLFNKALDLITTEKNSPIKL